MPSTSDNLSYLAAKLALDIRLDESLSDADVIWTTIDALMNEGFYDDTCLMALDSKPPRLAEALPAFYAALRHFQIVNTDAALAEWIFVEYHARRIVEPGSDPYDELRSIMTFSNTRAAHDFMCLYWSIDERREMSLTGQLSDSECSDVNREISNEAQLWLRELPTNAEYLRCLRQAEST